MAGYAFVTSLFVLPGFCSDTRNPKPVFILRLLLIQVLNILVII